jgi:class 3 adenylate cyclase
VRVCVCACVCACVCVRDRWRAQHERRVRRVLEVLVPAHVSAQLARRNATHAAAATSDRTAASGAAVAGAVVGAGGSGACCVRAVRAETLLARAHTRVALCLLDVCAFARIAACVTPAASARLLDECFALIERCAEPHARLVKIKTFGDTFFAACGLTCDDDKGGSDDHDSNAGDAAAATASANVLTLLEFCLDVQHALATHRFALQPDEIVRSADADDDEHHYDSASSSDSDERSDTHTHDYDYDDAGVVHGVQRHERRLRACVREAFVRTGGGGVSVRMRVRAGVHCGDVVAGIIAGRQPVSDTLWRVCGGCVGGGGGVCVCVCVCVCVICVTTCVREHSSTMCGAVRATCARVSSARRVPARWR